MRNLSKIKYLIVGLMLILAWLQISNQILFSHTHILNGKYVVHAHPFDSSSEEAPIKQHNHSKCHLFYINNGYLAIFQSIGVEIPILQPLVEIDFGYYQNYSNLLLSISDSNRAPPAL